MKSQMFTRPRSFVMSSTDFPLSIDQFISTIPSNHCQDVIEYFDSDETTLVHFQAMFGLFYTFVFVAGVMGNGLVIASVCKYPALQTVRNFFIVSLSCSDIVVCLTSLPITPVTVIKKNWVFGSFLCYAFPLFQGMSICISTFTLMAVAVDRYILIIFPTKRPIQRAQAVPMIITIWALAAGVCAPMVAHYKYYYGPDRVSLLPLPVTITPVNSTEPSLSTLSPQTSTGTMVSSASTQMYTGDGPSPVFCGYFCDELWPSERIRKIYGTFVLILQFLVPLIVIAFCYSHIWIRLARSAKMKKAKAAGRQKKFSRSGLSTAGTSGAPSTAIGGASTTVSPGEARQQAVLRRKRRTNRMLIAMVFIFACSWFPQVTMNLLRDLNWLPDVVYGHMYFYSLLCHAIAMTSTVWNPLLYSYMNSAFRNAFTELMPCFTGIKRTLSRRMTTKRLHEQKRLSRPDMDSNCGGPDDDVNRATARNRSTTITKPILHVSMDNPDKPGGNRRKTISDLATERSALLEDTAQLMPKSIRARNGVMNGEALKVMEDDC